MSTPHAQGRGLGDELTNALMIGLVAVFSVAVVLRAAGSIAAFLSPDSPMVVPETSR